MTRFVRRPGTDIGLMRYEASTKALAEAEKQKLAFPPKPVYDVPHIGQLPDLFDMHDGELMRWFQQFGAWGNWMGAQLAVAQIDERNAEKNLDYARATAMIDKWGGKGEDRVAVAKAQTETDGEVRRLRDIWEDRHDYRKVIEVMFNNLERDAAILSREITRRSNSPHRGRVNS